MTNMSIKKHKEIAGELLKKGFAYKCYCSEDEIKEQKEKAKKLLLDLIAMPLSEDEPVEDFEQQSDAKGFLADWK